MTQLHCSTEMPIADIRVGKRYRKDMGDLDALAASIAEIGLLHPIVVTPDKHLVAGQRRVFACQRLGWDTVPARIVDLDSKASSVVRSIESLPEDDKDSVLQFIEDQDRSWREQVYTWISEYPSAFPEETCQVCGYRLFVEKHHFLPKSMGGTDDPRNLVPLCPTHHRGVHWLIREVVTTEHARDRINFWRSDGQQDPLLFKYYLGRIEPIAQMLRRQR